jgi:hypothetical protein
VISFSHDPPVRTGKICIDQAKKNPHGLSRALWGQYAS